MAAQGVVIPSATPSTETVPERRPVFRNLMLVSGIVASLLYIAMIVVIRYPGYSRISQVPSELTAIGAPTRTLWSWLGWVYMALVLAFGWGVWKSAGGNRPLRVVGGSLLASGLLGFLWPLAPMHQREVLAAGGGTLGDTMHVVLGIVTVLLFLVTVGFGAAAFGRRFRFYSIATMAIALLFGVLLGLDSPGIQANLPTPWVGLWERINIGVYMVWVVVLAIILLRQRDTAGPATGRHAATGDPT